VCGKWKSIFMNTIILPMIIFCFSRCAGLFCNVDGARKATEAFCETISVYGSRHATNIVAWLFIIRIKSINNKRWRKLLGAAPGIF